MAWHLKSAATIRDASRIQTPGGVGLEDAGDLIAHATEYHHLFLLRAGGMRGVIETPVMPIYLAGKHRACLIGIAANCDYRFDILLQKFIEMLGAMGGNIDADFCHGFDGQGVNVTRGIRAGAGDDKSLVQCLTQQTLGEMRTTGISCAKNQDHWFHKVVGENVGIDCASSDRAATPTGSCACHGSHATRAA